jgi:hypothetical protein
MPEAIFAIRHAKRPEATIVVLRSPLPDDEALHATAEMTADVGEPRHGKPRAVRPDPALGLRADVVCD